MSRFLCQLYRTTAMLVMVVVLLQFAGAGFGAHQLHQGNSQEEEQNHAHLQFTAKVSVLEQCVESSADRELHQSQHLGQSNGIANEHQHLTTDTQEFDLCIDCQCHGGHVTVISQVVNLASEPIADLLSISESKYLPPESFPNYRPPIA